MGILEPYYVLYIRLYIHTLMKFFVFLLLYLFSSIPSYSQYHHGFRWLGADRQFYEIDTQRLKLLSINAQGNKVEIDQLLSAPGVFDELPNDYDVVPFYKGDSTLFSVPGTGQLYSVNRTTKRVRRLDNTFFRGYNFFASQFIRQDTLYSVGGEGFWLRHNLITRYNTINHEWEVVKPANTNSWPSINWFSGYSSKYDQFFSVYLRADSVLKGVDIPFTLYSFAQNRWEHRGTVSARLTELAIQGYKSIWTGEYAVVYSVGMPLKVYLVDPFRNKLYSCAPTDDKFFFSNSTIYSIDSLLVSVQYTNTVKHGKYRITAITIHDLLARSELIGPFYKETQPAFIVYIIAGLVVLLIVYLAYRANNNKQTVEFSEQELLLLAHILKGEDVKINSKDLTSLLGIDKYSFDNQRQLRNRLINSVNEKLYTVLNNNELIIRINNELDKRTVDYCRNPEISNTVLRKLRKQYG